MDIDIGGAPDHHVADGHEIGNLLPARHMEDEEIVFGHALVPIRMRDQPTRIGLANHKVLGKWVSGF
jgi:hypothetical protein